MYQHGGSDADASARGGEWVVLHPSDRGGRYPSLSCIHSALSVGPSASCMAVSPAPSPHRASSPFFSSSPPFLPFPCLRLSCALALLSLCLLVHLSMSSPFTTLWAGDPPPLIPLSAGLSSPLANCPARSVPCDRTDGRPLPPLPLALTRPLPLPPFPTLPLPLLLSRSSAPSASLAPSPTPPSSPPPFTSSFLSSPSPCPLPSFSPPPRSSWIPLPPPLSPPLAPLSIRVTPFSMLPYPFHWSISGMSSPSPPYRSGEDAGRAPGGGCDRM